MVGWEVQGGICWTQVCPESLGCIPAADGDLRVCESEELDYRLSVFLCASVR